MESKEILERQEPEDHLAKKKTYRRLSAKQLACFILSLSHL